MNFNPFIAVAVESFALLKYFTAYVGILLQMFRKKMVVLFSEFKESKNKLLGLDSSYFRDNFRITTVSHTKFSTRISRGMLTRY